MPNHLQSETSPYLLQHADNPVDWYPWGPAALQLAREQDKPIFLSIGYSACHWCHVMAHESFEDPDTAAIMNRLYINIKVDREERPDLDKIYQTAHQIIAQRPGGWPLSVFLTPDSHSPFFAGTYFPKQARYNLPGFGELLQRAAEFFASHRDEIDQQHQALVDTLNAVQRPQADGERPPQPADLTPEPLDLVRQQLSQAFDDRLGGFGAAPKFPHPTSMERLLRHYAATSLAGAADRQALDMTRFTLQRMGSGGIFDQLGGGFCRYSVDEQWMIPHFEKMLYDNGPLLSLYAQTWQITGEPFFRQIAEQTADWALRDMQSTDGGFYSAYDADSEGEEGKFYVWTPDQVQSLLTPAEYDLVRRLFGLDRAANFEGNWHLHRYIDIEQAAGQLDIDTGHAEQRWQSARDKLLQARNQRIWPGRDDKILTSWNAMMISGLATAGRLLDRGDYLQAAGNAVDFLHRTLWRDDRLLATCKDGKAHMNAYLDDYALLIEALLNLLQARWRRHDLDWAIQLADTMLEHYEDPRDGGFYFTANDHEQLLQRPKPLSDDATPSGNGIAALVLIRLGHLLGENRYLDAAGRCLAMAWPAMKQVPQAHNALLLALEEWIYPTETIILRGTTPTLDQWQRCCQQHYAPRRFCIAIPSAETGLPGLLAERKPSGDVIAYHCAGHQCQAPIPSFDALQTTLKETEPTPIPIP